AHYICTYNKSYTRLDLPESTDRVRPVSWPAHSPDLTPPDFFLWEISKNIVHQNNPITPQHVKQRLVAACATINPEATTGFGDSTIPMLHPLLCQE
ncbi:hypothetical protein WH47_06159, partial [Habropoda laboriosa]